MSLQVLADPGQVHFESENFVVPFAVVSQDVVHVKVQDVSVEAADAHVILRKSKKERETVRKGLSRRTTTVDVEDEDVSYFVAVDVGQQFGAALIGRLQTLELEED